MAAAEEERAGREAAMNTAMAAWSEKISEKTMLEAMKTTAEEVLATLTPGDDDHTNKQAEITTLITTIGVIDTELTTLDTTKSALETAWLAAEETRMAAEKALFRQEASDAY